MGETIEFPRRDSYASGTAVCLHCKKEWAATCPMPRKDDFMECPHCSRHMGMFKYPFCPRNGDSVFTCKCGGELFYILLDRTLCPNCGQTWSKD